MQSHGPINSINKDKSNIKMFSEYYIQYMVVLHCIFLHLKSTRACVYLHQGWMSRAARLLLSIFIATW